MLAVEAVNALRSLGVDATLDIVGRPHVNEEVEKLNRLSYPWLKVHGYRSDVSKFLARSDLVLITSTPDGEALPRAALEAHSHGVPVVTTNTGSVSDVVKDGETGYVLSVEMSSGWHPDELAALAAKVLVDRGEWRRLSEGARKHSEANFVCETTAAKHMTFYRSLLNG